MMPPLKSLGFSASVILLSVWLVSCIASQVAQDAVTPDGTVSPENVLPTPVTGEDSTKETPSTSDIHDANCLRPYKDSSIWNLPINWSVARIHPQSDAMMAVFFEGENWIGSNVDSYAPNLYFVSNATKLVPVTFRYRFQNVIDDTRIEYGVPGEITSIPLPPEAEPAPGTDGQLVVVNLESGEEWGLSKGRIDIRGRWSADGGYRYSIYYSGIPPKGFGHRGGGIGHLAGVIRPCEVERGYVDHAVTLAYDYPCAPETCRLNGWPEVIFPFTKTDGLGLRSYDIPEGTRIAIRPEITKDAIAHACSEVRGCIVWVLAMQKYGGFIVDDSGHPKTYAEGNKTAAWNSRIWSADMLKDIPTDWYVVIDWNFPSVPN